MDNAQNMLMGYMDGIAVTFATYVLSPPADKIRNSVIIGVIHAVLHPWACDKLHETKERDPRIELTP